MAAYRPENPRAALCREAIALTRELVLPRLGTACLTCPFARHSPERWVTAAAFWGILSMEMGNLPWTL